MLLRVVLLLLLWGFSAHAQNSRQSVKLPDLPAAVQKTVVRQQAGAEVVRLEKTIREGKIIYELEVSRESSNKTVFMDDAGKILEIKQPVKLREVSKAARSVIESSVGKGTILSLQSVKTAAGIIAAYEVQFELQGKKTALRIGPDGSLAQE